MAPDPNRADYPPAAAELLGEACTAAALFTGHAKVQGQLAVQLRGGRGLRTVFAECTGTGKDPISLTIWVRPVGSISGATAYPTG